MQLIDDYINKTKDEFDKVRNMDPSNNSLQIVSDLLVIKTNLFKEDNVTNIKRLGVFTVSELEELEITKVGQLKDLPSLNDKELNAQLGIQSFDIIIGQSDKNLLGTAPFSTTN